MPRDASPTRDALIDAGRSLFARDGVFSVPLSRVVAASGQKNASALHYHFGGREGLLDAIIAVHNQTIEAQRQTMLDGLGAGESASLFDLVSAYVEPQTELLISTTGRQFLTIIGQLQDLFDRWTEPGTPEQAARVLQAISMSLAGDIGPELRHERISRFLGMVAQALGSRARAIERGVESPLSHDAFVANLVSMSTGALTAP